MEVRAGETADDLVCDMIPKSLTAAHGRLWALQRRPPASRARMIVHRPQKRNAPTLQPERLLQ